MPSYQAITVWQPWATLIAEGIKTHEMRGRAPPRHLVGARVAIHAGARKVVPAEVRKLLIELRGTRGGRGLAMEVGPAVELLERFFTEGPGIFPLRHVLCTVRLGVALSPETVRARWANDSDRDEHFNWAWPMLDVRRLEPPVPANGSQGWWSVDLPGHV